jgi:ketoreductase RED2
MAYAMSKAALNHLVALLAKSSGPVRVNAVAPGLVETPLTAGMEAQRAATAEAVPLHRSARPDDCAEAVIALLRNAYMTGQVLVVDGGSTLIW